MECGELEFISQKAHHTVMLMLSKPLIMIDKCSVFKLSSAMPSLKNLIQALGSHPTLKIICIKIDLTVLLERLLDLTYTLFMKTRESILSI